MTRKPPVLTVCGKKSNAKNKSLYEKEAGHPMPRPLLLPLALDFPQPADAELNGYNGSRNRDDCRYYDRQD